MAIRSIVTASHPIVRRKAKPVKKVNAEIRALCQDMLETMRAAPGVGLAAPQIAVPLRVIVVEVPEEDAESHIPNPLVLINPQIIEARGSEEGAEACLSVPGFAGYVTRATEVTVRGLNRQGKKVRYRAHGFLARVLQHEIDHLDGILFIDRVESPDKLWRIEPEEEKGSSLREGL